MKKSIKSTLKTLGVAAVALPCALMFTACGGNGQVKVNTASKNYTASSYAEASEYFNQVETAGKMDFKGLKFTTVVTMSQEESIPDGEQATILSSMSMKTTINGAISYDEEILAKCDYSSSVKMSGAGTNMDTSGKGNLWIKDGYMYTYMKANGVEQKQKIKFDNSMEGSPTEPSFSVPSSNMVNNLLDSLTEIDAADINVRVANENTTIKYEIKTSSAEMGEVTFYLIFKNDQLTEFQFTTKMEMGGMKIEMVMNAKGTTDKVTVNKTFDQSYVEIGTGSINY